MKTRLEVLQLLVLNFRILHQKSPQTFDQTYNKQFDLVPSYISYFFAHKHQESCFFLSKLLINTQKQPFAKCSSKYMSWNIL